MSIDFTRRQFVFTAAASAAFGLSAKTNDEPLLRIGAMTDDHLHPNRPETHIRTKACFELFRKYNADIVVDTGDIADLSHVSELQCFRKYFDEAFAGTKCVPFFCIANHDYNYVPNTKKNDPVNIENAWKALGMSSANPTAVVNGYQFVNVFQNEPDANAFEKAIEKAVAANKDNRPVFVVNHVPPMFTTTGTEHWSAMSVRRVLNKFPQVVALTGHIHTAINWAANIWQGEFTTINLGAHAEYSNKIRGEAMMLYVYADRIDIRRYEAVSGREISANDRWSIPLPLDPANGPYRPEVRVKECPVPTLPADAVVTFKQAANGSSGTLSFASASPQRSAKYYRIMIESQAENGNWEFLGALNWEAPQVMDEPEKWECPLQPAMLNGGRPHRATITPVNSHDVAGKSATFNFDAPPNPMELIPAEVTKIYRYQRSYEPNTSAYSPDKDGWLKKDGGLIVAVLPKEFTAAIIKKRSISLMFDIATKQAQRPNTFSIGKFPAAGGKVELGLGGRIYTNKGDYDSHRYVWTISKGSKPNLADEFCLIIREGDAGQFKINSIKCFAN